MSVYENILLNKTIIKKKLKFINLYKLYAHKYMWIYFINFLWMNGVAFAYGTYICGNIIYRVIVGQRLFQRTFIDNITGQKYPASLSLVFHHVMAIHQVVGFLFISASVMGFVMFLFWGWHIYLATTNMTTSEKAKYSHLKCFLTFLEKNNLTLINPQKASTVTTLVNADGNEKTANMASTTISSSTDEKVLDDTPKHMDETPLSTSNPPNQPDSSSIPPSQKKRPPFQKYTGEWKDVNIYDKGVINNVMQVLFPFRNYSKLYVQK
ncbi:hypothetical protein RFI_15322 [Reticulomyxa filosa]|uniref:Palmitoyltransferase n=1 Tax=Reticulomyxa filosa TaxID=46433 RepID=X6N798_RETFI|nr:hypothetical protein RFI_15322 [Reticulomyxa filosa]|eukprot:ETO21881.1 hypothetical protein RFI_15322 [Reticulomyxa filosa]